MNHLDKANKSQRIVASFLRDRGFTLAEVNHPTANGIDIVAIKNNKHFRIEVKSIIRTGRAWRVGKPHPDCDYIAVVTDNGLIHFESMSDWMRLATSDGSRHISSLVSLLNEL